MRQVQALSEATEGSRTHLKQGWKPEDQEEALLGAQPRVEPMEMAERARVP